MSRFDYLGEPTPYGGDSTTLLNFTDPAEQARMAQQIKELAKSATAIIALPPNRDFICSGLLPKLNYYLFRAGARVRSFL